MREKPATAGIGNRLFPKRFVVFAVLLLGVLAAVHWGFGAHWADSAALAFDAAALVFLGSLVPLVRSSDAPDMRRHALENDANRGLMLFLTTLLAFAVMAAITGELAGARNGETPAIAKLVGTLVLIWLFANSIYALHYAHIYYSRSEKNGGDTGGLQFPGTKTPDYPDFAYFAFTLGMTFQTSDVAITQPAVRHVALLHSFVAFVFNIGVIAFTINALGGG